VANAGRSLYRILTDRERPACIGECARSRARALALMEVGNAL
jgi:hypothetical protein